MTAEGTRDPEAVVEAQRDIQEEVARDERSPAPKKRAPCRPAPAAIRSRPSPSSTSRSRATKRALDPAPMYDAPFWKGSGKLDGQGRADHRRRLRHRARRRRALRPRGRRRRDRLSRRGRRRRGDRGGGRGRGPPGDRASAATSPTASSAARRWPGRCASSAALDVLVNNAAFQVHTEDFLDLSPEHFDETLKTNLYGYFHMAQAAAAEMKPGSAIINTGSVTGIDGSKELVDYSMTKGGIHAFTRALAGNLVPRGIRVNAVAPGPGLDPAQPVRQGAREGRAIRREDADEAAGPARGDRAGLCLPRLAAMLELHHRRDSADHRRVLTGYRRRCRRITASCEGGRGSSPHSASSSARIFSISRVGHVLDADELLPRPRPRGSARRAWPGWRRSRGSGCSAPGRPSGR